MQLATVDQKPPAAQADQHKALRVTGKLKRMIDVMVWEGLSPAEAALKVNYRGWRRWFTHAHVIAYLTQQSEVLRVSNRPRNIHRLMQIREAADNMPAVNAIKELRQPDDEQAQHRSGVSASPGVTIRVINVIQGSAVPTYRDSMSGTDAKQINDLAESDRS